MSITTHALGAPYSDNNQLPAILRAFEGYVPMVYDDLAPPGAIGPGHYATIGIGLNIRGNRDALRLVLDYLGVFQADNATQEALRFQAGQPQRTAAQVLARHDAIVADFAAVIAGHPLNGVQGQEGSSTSERALQTALAGRLAFYGVAGAFEFQSEIDARVVKMRLVQGYAVGPYVIAGFESRLDTLLAGTGFAHDTREYMALMSLYFNGEGATIPANSKLVAALYVEDRAEAWFQIRYGSNGGASSALPGIAKRRYFEAELFGLYDDPAGPTVAESKQVFEMLSTHRQEILAYEARWGVPPDGSTIPNSNMIAAAVGDQALVSFARVQTLFDALRPARDAFIAWVNTLLPAGREIDASILNPAAIYYTPSTAGQAGYLDASGDDGKGAALEHNVLVGGTGDDNLFGGSGDDVLVGPAGDDRLRGELGDDELYGGVGNDYLAGEAGTDVLYGGDDCDTYVIDLRDGASTDRIVDSGGSGRIVIVGADGQLLNTAVFNRQGTQNAWVDPDGRVTISHSSPWRITLADGSVIELGENFDAASFGMSLQEERAPVTTTLTGDYLKQTNPEGTGYVLGADGNYASNGPQPGAADVINGSAGADSIQGLGGNDGLSGGGGDDEIEGGAGDDLLLGGSGADKINGGDGNDEILGSASGGIDRPTSVNFTPPVATGPEDARGFSWVIYKPPGNTYLIAGGGDIYPNGETTGNIIDGGAGNDRIGAGTGADVVHGGDGDDIIIGMGQGDVLFSDAGADIIEGDGRAVVSGWYTAAAEHGNDVLSGGAGNDHLTGQGGNDELYGGADDDALYGDDTDAVNTPLANHGSDYLDGGDGADSLVGGGRNDDLFGGIGDDRLWGDAGAVPTNSTEFLPAQFHGDDYLDGEDGMDYLVGRSANDLLIAGAARGASDSGRQCRRDWAFEARGIGRSHGDQGYRMCAAANDTIARAA